MSTGTVGKVGTGLSEDLDLDKDSTDDYAHYVRKIALVAGGPVEALCGKKWRPRKKADGLPVCPACKDMMDLLHAMDGV